MSTVAHFAINADDINRARRFYGNVFGWKFQAYGPPGFYMIDWSQTGAEVPLRGSLQQRRYPRRSKFRLLRLLFPFHNWCRNPFRSRWYRYPETVSRSS